jgi:BMFP domain-containing protein YqiC
MKGGIMKDKQLKKRIEKTHKKLDKLNAKLQKLEIKQAKRTAKKAATIDSGGLPAMPVN